MRKIVSFLILISLIFSLTACSKKMEAVSSGKEGYRENTFFSNDDIKITGDEASLPKNAVFNFELADEGRDLSSNLLKGMEEVRKISAKSIFFFIRGYLSINSLLFFNSSISFNISSFSF